MQKNASEAGQYDIAWKMRGWPQTAQVNRQWKSQRGYSVSRARVAFRGRKRGSRSRNRAQYRQWAVVAEASAFGPGLLRFAPPPHRRGRNSGGPSPEIPKRVTLI